jgi:hypothetical protein
MFTGLIKKCAWCGACFPAGRLPWYNQYVATREVLLLLLRAQTVIKIPDQAKRIVMDAMSTTSTAPFTLLNTHQISLSIFFVSQVLHCVAEG